jgi:hypothetical protein
MAHIRPEVTTELIEQINQMIINNPDWHRSKLSVELCMMWDWKSPNGVLKDMSCRDMLRALDKAGKIKLPAPKKNVSPSSRRSIMHREHDTTPIVGRLDALRPLNVKVVEKGAELAEFKSLIDQYHYLKFDRTVGENMKYMVYSNGGATLACLLFGSAAWSCRDRDAYIGWRREQRVARLHLLTNNTRFIVFPWITIPNLASHILSLVARRISSDWEAKYGHKILAIETFVEQPRFRGSCYQAANWIRIGRTLGRGRNDTNNLWALPEKDIYLLPLTRRWRESILEEQETGGSGNGTMRYPNSDRMVLLSGR